MLRFAHIRQKAQLSIINSVGSTNLREEIFHLHAEFPVVWIPIEMNSPVKISRTMVNVTASAPLDHSLSYMSGCVA